MSLLSKLLLSAGIFGALVGAACRIHDGIYDDGYHAGLAKAAEEAGMQRAKIERANAGIAHVDQELLVAKAQDKEKIVTIYRTIRDQVDAHIMEEPVFNECRVPADGLRLIARAAAGGDVPADPEGAARDPAPATAGAQR